MAHRLFALVCLQIAVACVVCACGKPDGVPPASQQSDLEAKRIAEHGKQIERVFAEVGNNQRLYGPQAVKSVSLLGTPMDFSEAFLMYVVALEEIESARIKKMALGTSTEAWQKANRQSLLGQARTAEEEFKAALSVADQRLELAASQVRLAEMKVRQVALSYGVEGRL